MLLLQLAEHSEDQIQNWAERLSLTDMGPFAHALRSDMARIASGNALQWEEPAPKGQAQPPKPKWRRMVKAAFRKASA